MYPSERYKHLTWDIPEDAKAHIEEYVDESYHQGITLKELGCRTWREVITALIQYEHSGSYSSTHGNLIDDYKLYKENIPEPKIYTQYEEDVNA